MHSSFISVTEAIGTEMGSSRWSAGWPKMEVPAAKGYPAAARACRSRRARPGGQGTDEEGESRWRVQSV
jgi:hypothetical protein